MYTSTSNVFAMMTSVRRVVRVPCTKLTQRKSPGLEDISASFASCSGQRRLSKEFLH